MFKTFISPWLMVFYPFIKQTSGGIVNTVMDNVLVGGIWNLSLYKGVTLTIHDNTLTVQGV